MIEHDENEVENDLHETGEGNEQQEWQLATALAEKAEDDSAEMAATGAPVDMPLDTLLTPCFIAIFGVLTPNWKISHGECAALGKAYADVIEEFFPNMQASPKMVVIGTAVATTSAVIAPRVMQGLPRKTEETEVN